ncbi:fatty acyl-CoA reductase 1-like [Harmonia axyridis]|uniref:fatty acyl-CoA reductase 1-like n=1 Tax=Harmonia axyridis TaxID=115357 RepID=UPI001E2796FE|nr:fatty acyl-CoA reductase 1-like [Harmonia axyridis]XP_045467338.1 fatty acyl-CoA reductase 1-like [Harmonia axyridis]XP_045467339.1 fatty acyl-CoA reductase 1-like [Harmonia axyridis]
MVIPKTQSRICPLDLEASEDLLKIHDVIDKNSNFVFNDDNNNNNNIDGPNNIGDFYKGTNIFITGATGFVGKALVEKLLRSCDGIDNIYLLMRDKRGLCIEQRLKDLFKNPVFEKIRDKNPDVFQKVKAINGDVSLPNLALSEIDRIFLWDNIDVVFHSAATVKFNEDLKNAMLLNTLGTKRVLDLCKEMKKLKSFVHVSTAFSNSDKTHIKETVYKPAFDLNSIMNCMDILPKDIVEMLSKKLLGKHPNTYTFTKALAEYLVLEYSSTIPAAVVRPSIITAAWKEPIPGWVDNMSGITGIFMECGRGTIKSIICDEKYVMDIIPVDVVVNTIITAGWHTHAYKSKMMRVYNCVTGGRNPVTWKRFGELTHKYVREYPSKYVQWYPGFEYRTNRFIHIIYATLYHTIPAALLDVFLYCTRQKPIMLRISNKFYHALEAGKFFSTNEWDFDTNTFESLANAVKHTEDGKEFNIDIHQNTSDFDWDQYVKNFMIGVRQYVLKDDLSSLPSAKAKLNRLYWFQKVFQLISVFALVRIATSR